MEQTKPKVLTQPLELYISLTGLPDQFKNVFVQVSELSIDQQALVQSLVPADKDKPQQVANPVKQISEFGQAGSEKVVGKTGVQANEEGRARFNESVTVPYIFEVVQIYSVSLIDASNNSLIDKSSLTLGNLVNSKSKNLTLKFEKQPSLKIKIMYEGLKSAVIEDQFNIAIEKGPQANVFFIISLF